MINILITAGGTSEPIDSVRSITNTGTGRLGSLIADAFAAEPSVGKIFYVCARNAVRPQSDKMTAVEVQSVSDLQAAITEITSKYTIDIIIHSMAVSDYRVRAVSTSEQVAPLLQETEDILQAMEATDIRKNGGKLSSHMVSPLILLEPTPKILPELRKLAPKAVIVGFKLLSQVPRETLIETAYRLLSENACDFVLANDSSDIYGDAHKGYLIDSERNIQTFATKQEIASGILTTIIKQEKKS